MGVVYEVEDTKLGVHVALKMLADSNAAGIYRFKQEFRAIADVVHPNLVGLHELFCVDDDWFFTMDWVQGDTKPETARRLLFASIDAFEKLEYKLYAAAVRMQLRRR